MDVSQLQTAAPAPAKAPAVANQTTSDFQTFLTLLTTQISNQDPLDPMKAEDFAVQLATFSSVEQQVVTNDLLKAMAGSTAGDEFMAMTGWIGRDVRAQMPLYYEGAPLTVYPQRPVAGARHELVVRNDAGVEVDRFTVGGSGEPVAWDGRDPAGRQLVAGVYSFETESFEGGTLVASEPVSAYGRVQEIRYSEAGPTLALAGGVELMASDVSAVRAAP
ncbi:flagellar hook capping FlgD N-terminal domain-containing protein [Palleronia rufa]|uniref:flagellar hook capping FlgD N-terminal domain-containing protein n=1 Tax=Palleronia rufa TaxID=1530186 RepID=UPI00055E9B71|nr:flagellar hook capping FlgD N-terminal domain-containing protein [Palleronia rufa]